MKMSMYHRQVIDLEGWEEAPHLPACLGSQSSSVGLLFFGSWLPASLFWGVAECLLPSLSLAWTRVLVRAQNLSLRCFPASCWDL